MKKVCYLLFLMIMTNKSFAQTDNYKVAISNFQKSYNSDKYNEIFNSFDDKMKEALPIDKIEQVFVGLKAEMGKIETTEFISQKGTLASFKTKFERGTKLINLSLDSQNKINGLRLKPYEEDSKTINGLKNYPKEVAELIYSKTKNLPNNTQLSIALIQNGKVDYFGIIKVNDTIKPAENQNKIFEIGSITKVFTSTVLAGLVVDKKLKLTDNINDYYTFSFKDNIKINFESLANHTSKLPRMPENFVSLDEKNPYKSYGKKEIEDYLQNVLKLENGTTLAYSYSNLGAGLLGHTLGLSQKMSFQDLLQKKVLDKYKMKNTFMSAQNIADKKLTNKLVKGQNEDGEIVSNWDLNVLFSAGGILSTTEDLAKFAYAQFDAKNKELALTQKPTADANGTMKIGLGWHIVKSENGQQLLWHNGGTGGYRSYMALNIKNKTGIIILSNVSSFSSKSQNIDDLSLELIKQIK